MMSYPQQEFVFILGITHRSGTNFLSDLLVHHPDCERVRTIWEDFILANAERLQQFAASVAACWNRQWDPDRQAEHELATYLGQACLDFLTAKTKQVVRELPRYLVTKTPSVNHLDLIPLFPGARAIVVVRDGRAVVESSVKSFGWDFETVAHSWARAADIIVSAQKSDTPFLVVRYEDLVLNLKAELTRIFSFLEIVSTVYDFNAAATLPVRGSSTLKTEDDDVHWDKMEKRTDFNPLTRWKDWTASEHKCFNAIAGTRLVDLGYEVVDDA